MSDRPLWTIYFKVRGDWSYEQKTGRRGDTADEAIAEWKKEWSEIDYRDIVITGYEKWTWYFYRSIEFA